MDQKCQLARPAKPNDVGITSGCSSCGSALDARHIQAISFQGVGPREVLECVR